MDIALLQNYSTNCFTKGYTKLFKGTGSILLLEEKLYKDNLNPLDLFGNIRYFTPKEILKFLCFNDILMDSLNNNINLEKINLLVFEFFSGIGGMHESLIHLEKIKIDKIFPFDINQNANSTYFENFKIKPFSISIESFSLNDYENLIKNNLKDNNIKILWTMSPPCQPFTRQGNMEGLNDNRSSAFIHLMNNIFLKTKNEFLPDFFILENVKNFEISEANKMLCDILNNKKYYFLQFLFSPNDFGVPNSRLRFYLIASKIKKFQIQEEYLNNIDKIIKDKNIILNDLNIVHITYQKKFLVKKVAYLWISLYYKIIQLIVLLKAIQNYSKELDLFYYWKKNYIRKI